MKMITEIFKNNYLPEKEICVDESLVLFKERLRFKQYIRTKRARFGIKLFSLCSSDGYLWNFNVYTGQGSDAWIVPPDAISLSVSEKIVVSLMKDLLDLGYSIYTDNWYTSIRLAEYLLEHDTLLTGTIRQNRSIPKDVHKEKLKKGQSVFVAKTTS